MKVTYIIFLLFFSFFIGTVHSQIDADPVDIGGSDCSENSSCYDPEYPEIMEFVTAGRNGGIPNITNIKATLSPGDNIQSAIDNGGAGVVLLTNGVYSVTNAINMRDNVVLRGQSKSGVKLSVDIKGGSTIIFGNGVNDAGLEDLRLVYEAFPDPPVEHRSGFEDGGFCSPCFQNDKPGYSNTLVRFSGSHNWVDNIEAINSGSDPIEMFGNHNTFRNSLVDNCYNKGGGGEGYFDIRGDYNLVTGSTVRKIRHFTIQGGAEYNVIFRNRIEGDVNYHNGDDGRNLVEQNTILRPSWHTWGVFATGGAQFGHDIPGPRNIIFNNTTFDYRENRVEFATPNVVYTYTGYGDPDQTNWPAPTCGTFYPVACSCDIVGDPCDDGNVCTVNDVIVGGCNCAGTLLDDDDNDGICDLQDQCPGEDDNLDSNQNGVPDFCECLPAISSSAQELNVAENTLDDDFSTRWSAFGIGEKIQYCLPSTTTLSCLNVAFHRGNERTATFDVDIQNTNGQWIQVLDGVVSSGNTLALERFDFPAISATKIRIIGLGNSENDWISITEVSWDNCCTGAGLACDDGNDCTINDVTDASCICVGQLIDSDNDGICDAEDTCPEFDNGLIGSPCDDGDPCTENDVYVSSCACEGEVPNTETEIVALEDAYLQGNSVFNNTILRVENGNRTSYLKFDLSSITSPIENIQLQLTQESDSGNGTVQIYASNNVAWSESSLTIANAPGQDVLVGSMSGNFSDSQEYTTDLNGLTNTGQFSLILVHSPGGNDMAFASSEFGDSNKHPRLIVNTAACTVVDQDCLTSITYTNNEDESNSISAMIFIQSNNIIKSGSNIEYKAGDFIDLTEEFEVELGAFFHALIESCN